MHKLAKRQHGGGDGDPKFHSHLRNCWHLIVGGRRRISFFQWCDHLAYHPHSRTGSMQTSSWSIQTKKVLRQRQRRIGIETETGTGIGIETETGIEIVAGTERWIE